MGANAQLQCVKHEIKILEMGKAAATVSIDGKTVKLARGGRRTFSEKRINVTDEMKIGLLLISLERCIQEENGFVSMIEMTTSTNILLLLDALYYDETIVWWKDVVKKDAIESSCVSCMRLFQKYFGCNFNHVMLRIPLVAEMKHYIKEFYFDEKNLNFIMNSRGYIYGTKGTKDGHKPRRAKRNSATYNGISVDIIKREGNIVVYLANGIECSICLSGNSEMQDALTIAKSISNLIEALPSYNEQEILSAIERMGYKAASQVIEHFCFENMVAFIDFELRGEINKRHYPLVAKTIKTYTQSYNNHLTNMLLDCFEPRVLFYEELLIAGNTSEIEKDSASWSLFYYLHENACCNMTLFFNGPEILMRQFRCFLRYKYQKKEKTVGTSSSTLFKYIARIYNALYRFFLWIVEDAVELDNMCDLTVWEFKHFLSHLVYDSGLAPASISAIFHYTYALYSFCCLSEGPDMQRIRKEELPNVNDDYRMAKHIEPLSPYAISQIMNVLYEFPVYIRLAFLLCLATGARAKTICMLTTDNIIQTPDGYAVRLYYYKNSNQRQCRGMSPYLTHKIPEQLALDLQSFINDTADLRKKMDKPYVFIYRPLLRRSDSKRRARVLNCYTFKGQINKALDCIQLYDEDGSIIRCTFARIRAEVGRDMLLNGYTEKEIAEKLGNTTLVAAEYYSSLTAKEEANLWNRHYQATIETIFHKENDLYINNESCTEKEKQYGRCIAPNPKCNQPSCDNCKMLITCKEKGGLHNRQPSS